MPEIDKRIEREVKGSAIDSQLSQHNAGKLNTSSALMRFGTDALFLHSGNASEHAGDNTVEGEGSARMKLCYQRQQIQAGFVTLSRQ